jgi:hypothetical protein
MDDLAAVSTSYVDTQREKTDWLVNQDKVNLFTSDYVLYWWDYQIGYNTVFAELFGTQTNAQTLALDRGAANMQDKSWGVMIEPENQSPLSLQNGTQMYDEMRQAYENGAEYAVVFNYSPSDNGIGLLQAEHFQALQRFWNDVVNNASEVRGGVKAEAVLVLPKDYGWGMRNPSDTIWGLWNANSASQQIWNQMQSKLAQYGSRLDIVYGDSAYNVAGKYSQIYYWNQTG